MAALSNYLIPRNEYRELDPLQMTVSGFQKDQTAIEMGSFIKFGQAELQERLIQVVDGKLYTPVDGFINGRRIYAMVKANVEMDDPNAFLIYAAEPIDGAVFHSSLSENPVAAGTFRAIDGKLTHIDEDSGHFQFSDRVKYVLSELSRKGAVFYHDLKVILASDRFHRKGDSPTIRVPSRLSSDERQKRLEEILSAKSPNSKSSTSERGKSESTDNPLPLPSPPMRAFSVGVSSPPAPSRSSVGVSSPPAPSRSSDGYAPFPSPSRAAREIFDPLPSPTPMRSFLKPNTGLQHPAVERVKGQNLQRKPFPE